MCELKIVLNVAALLLVATSFCIYQVKSEKKHIHRDTIAKSKVKSLRKRVQKVLFERWRMPLSR